ncbi:preprotein translocase subunit YajC [Paractinoplanes lichenicola]|uniref:Preprotein translocase subunit YajC n=1 Tax=Paractinoplanes lichenicola TaxID=2802976 RepID=A0ABS1W3A1_9ACTN|nr:preprotein translocase subunit YajC [Actinoplanes lichenicola]MBL7261216.1 preprotein translocase subunit YajC [Actinoplanes lichenicola]
MIQAAEASGGGSFTPLLLIVLLFAVMYFLMIRPQQKRRREAQQMQNALGPGDRIVTIGGLHGTVVSVDDDVVTLDIADGVHVQFARPAIARVLPAESAVPVAEEIEEPLEPAVEEPVVDPVTDTRKKD